jgi:branched-chain amino acid transport system substrate-binding protein
MYSALTKYQPGVLTDQNFGETVIQAWTAMSSFAAAVKAGGTSGSALTPAQVLDGLYTFNDQTLGGLAPGLTFKKGQKHSVSCWFWLRTNGSAFTTPYGLTASCAS